MRYTPDENRYKAKSRTNEIGKESKDSADVTSVPLAITGKRAGFKVSPIMNNDEVQSPSYLDIPLASGMYCVGNGIYGFRRRI